MCHSEVEVQLAETAAFLMNCRALAVWFLFIYLNACMLWSFCICCCSVLFKPLVVHYEVPLIALFSWYVTCL